MNCPLVSVIIPTANRPQYLPRAVKSALAGMKQEEVEVIVVPNGPDQSWRTSLCDYLSHPSLRVIPISVANANVARNTGLEKARGHFIRFLDDDDYLIPASSRDQTIFALKSEAEFCSGRLLNIDEDERPLEIITFPKTSDFFCASFSISGFTLPTGNLIRRDCIRDIRWNPASSRTQDYVWMINLSAAREWKWLHYEAPVGYWYQHPNQRISTMRTSTDRPNQIIEIILALYKDLEASQRLNDSRRQAICSALWYFVHRSFPHQPLYLTNIASKARKICPGSRPEHPIFNSDIFNSLDPLAAEWIMLPLRLLVRAFKDVRGFYFGWDYRRRL